MLEGTYLLVRKRVAAGRMPAAEARRWIRVAARMEICRGVREELERSRRRDAYRALEMLRAEQRREQERGAS